MGGKGLTTSARLSSIANNKVRNLRCDLVRNGDQDVNLEPLLITLVEETDVEPKNNLSITNQYIRGKVP